MPLRRIGLSRLIGPGLVVVAVLSVSGAALAQELRALFSPWDDIEGVLVEALAKALNVEGSPGQLCLLLANVPGAIAATILRGRHRPGMRKMCS